MFGGGCGGLALGIDDDRPDVLGARLEERARGAVRGDVVNAAVRRRPDVQVLELLNKKDPAKIPGFIAQMLLTDSPGIRLYGRRRPLKVTERIPLEEASELQFSDDARALVDAYSDDQKYVGLAIRRSDLMRRISELAPSND